MVTSSRARVVALSVLGMLLMQVAWILSVPPFMGIDEIDHTYRASSIGLGELRPLGTFSDPKKGRGDLVSVRSDVVEAAHGACKLLPYYGKANCTPVGPGPQPGSVLVASSAASYDPAFYATIGAVARPFTGYAYEYALRIAAGLLCTVLFGAAVWCLQTFARTRWPVALLFLGTTPMTLYSTTVAAPNGLEMVSGLTLWAALLGLFCSPSRPSPRDRRSLQVVAAVSGSVLVTVHTLGPVWLALTAVTVLVLAHPTHVWRRLRGNPRGHAVMAAVVALATLGSVAWVLSANTNNPASENLQFRDSPFPELFRQLVLWPLQAIGSFPTRTEPAPPIVYAVALVLTLWATVAGIRAAGSRERRALLTVVVLSIAVPVGLTLVTYSRVGMAWQGRYGLPYCVAFFLILGLALERAAPSPRLRPFPLLLAGVLLATELVASLRGVVERELKYPVWQDSPHWSDPGLLLLTLLVLAGLAAWGYAVLMSAPERLHAPASTSVETREPVRSDP